MRHIALISIRLYRRYVSPYKGFGCAHRLLAGSESCSAYGLRMIERFGVPVGVGLLRRRLRACTQLNLLHRSSMWPPVRPRRNRQAGFCDGCDVPCDCAGPFGACETATDVIQAVADCSDCRDFFKRRAANRDDMVDIRSPSRPERPRRDS